MLLIPLQLITVIIIATVVTITTTVLMQVIAKSITFVHFQVRVCNTRPASTRCQCAVEHFHYKLENVC